MPFDLAAVEETARKIAPFVAETPVSRWDTPFVVEEFGTDTEIFLKLELFQRTGTFKVRGAMSNALSLSPEELRRGLTAVSAGNHAIAVAFAAHQMKTTAKVVMSKSANRYRVAAAKAWGAEVVLAADIADAFAQVKAIQEGEGRVFIHPFDGLRTCLGTATLGAEFMRQVPNMDAVVIAVGGGGLFGGASRAIKLTNPDCKVYAVEPEGADNLRRALEAGQPVPIEISTIADSLAPPHCAEFSFALCRDHLDKAVTVSDAELRRAMVIMLEEAKLAVEPAGAAATAALLWRLKDELRGQRAGLVICGSNIDAPSFARLISEA